MKKEEMLRKVANGGVGVKFEHKDGTITYAQYEGIDAIDKAYQDRDTENMTFYGQAYARRELFLGYMDAYRKACEAVDKVDENAVLKPYDEDVQVEFKKAHSDLDNMIIVLCRRLMHWTGCNFASAKKQIVTDSVTYSAF